MKCYNHPEVDAIGTCVGCGKPICVACNIVVKEKFYCPACARKTLEESRGLVRGLVDLFVGIFRWEWRFLKWLFGIDKKEKPKKPAEER